MSKTIYINNTPEENKIINKTGNKVQLNLSVPIKLDDGKKYYLRCLQGSIVYCDPNVTHSNNLFKWYYNGQLYPFYLPVGLYDIKSLNTTISNETLLKVNNSKVFRFVADASTSIISVYFYVANTYIDCTDNYTDPQSKQVTTRTNVMSLLGFPPSYTITNPDKSTTTITNDQLGNFGTITIGTFKTKIGTYKAQLNTLQNILVRCNIVQGCSYLNNTVDNIIASVFPDTQAWGTIYYKPYFPPKCLINVKNIYQLVIELLDQDGVPVDFNSDGDDPTSERWNLELEIFSE